MPRTVLNARLHVLALLLIWAAWMFTTGAVLGHYAVEISFVRPGGTDLYGSAAFTVLLAVIVWVLLNARLPELARRARVWPTRVVGLAAIVASMGLSLGAATHFPQALGRPLLPETGINGLLLIRGAVGIVGLILILFMPAND